MQNSSTEKKEAAHVRKYTVNKWRGKITVSIFAKPTLGGKYNDYAWKE